MFLQWLNTLENDSKLQDDCISDGFRNALVDICRSDMLVLEDGLRKPISEVAGKLRNLSLIQSFDVTTNDFAASQLSDLTTVGSSASTSPDVGLTNLSTNPLITTEFTQYVTNAYQDVSGFPQHSTHVPEYFTAPETLLHTSPPQVLEEKIPINYHTTPAPLLDSPQTKCRKRCAKDQSSPPESDVNVKTRKVEPTPRFGCPYHKFDPATYNIHDSRWRTCVGPGWTSVHRVKYVINIFDLPTREVNCN